MTDLAVRSAVDQLREAGSHLKPCGPIRELIGPDNIDAAYDVQRILIGERLTAGRHRIGRKIGLTAPAVQAQLGVDQPDFGILLSDMRVPDGGAIGAGRLLQPKAEAEVAFRLGADLSGTLTPETVRAAVHTAHAAIEIVDSRIAGWDITIADTVADNASSGLFVIAEEGPDLTQLEPAGVAMELAVDGAVKSTGNGRACLGDPLNALLWLARKAMSVGDPLRAGEIVLSGALGPMVPVAPGNRLAARIRGLGTVEVTLEEQQ